MTRPHQDPEPHADLSCDAMDVQPSIHPLLAPVEPLAIDAEGAARLLGLSRSMFYKMAEAGKIGPQGRRFGRCVRYSLPELKCWAHAGMPPRHQWNLEKENQP